MSFLHKLILLLMGVTAVPVGYVFYSAALSSHDWVYQGHGQWADAGQHGAPGDAGRQGAPGPPRRCWTASAGSRGGRLLGRATILAPSQSLGADVAANPRQSASTGRNFAHMRKML
jgi:hypothetical protein